MVKVRHKIMSWKKVNNYLYKCPDCGYFLHLGPDRRFPQYCFLCGQELTHAKEEGITDSLITTTETLTFMPTQLTPVLPNGHLEIESITREFVETRIVFPDAIIAGTKGVEVQCNVSLDDINNILRAAKLREIEKAGEKEADNHASV